MYVKDKEAYDAIRREKESIESEGFIALTAPDLMLGSPGLFRGLLELANEEEEEILKKSLNFVVKAVNMAANVSDYQRQRIEDLIGICKDEYCINFDNPALANILGFIAIFLAINIAVGIIVSIINRILHIIPFIDLINKLLGGIVGLLGGALAISAFVYLLSLFSFSETISDLLIKSQIAHWAADISIIIKPFIPEAIKQLQSIL